MKTFIIEETIPCYVTWRCEIQAATESEALKLWSQGERGKQGESEPMIGDSISWVHPERPLEITEVQR